MNRLGWRITTNLIFGTGGMAVVLGWQFDQPAIGFIILLAMNFLGYWAMDNYAKVSQREVV